MKPRNIKRYCAVSFSLITFAVYLSALRNGFVGWDDGTYIVDNPHIRALNGTLLKWAFFDFYASNWHPLTWISHALDYAIWGLNPMGHHLTNNILHALNTFLVVLLAVRLLEVWRAKAISEGRGAFLDEQGILITGGITGLLFGIHPLHVESVAWVSERKDLLCALFFLFSTMAYTRYVTQPILPLSKGRGKEGSSPIGNVTSPSTSYPKRVWQNRLSYLLSLAFFLLALLSKPMAVSLPAVLLLLDWYPFERIRSLKTFLGSVIEKLPFVALSIGSSILTILAQEKAMFLNEFVPLPARVLVAARAVFVYLGKMLFPFGLSPFYAYSRNVYLLSPKYFMAIILLIGVSAACIVIIRRQKAWLSIWGYYVVTLVPVLGIVQVGGQSMADRYTYLPSIGPFLVAGLLVAWVYRKTGTLKRANQVTKVACTFLALCLVLCLAYLTFKQIGIWNNTVGLWSYVIQKEPEVPFAYHSRGLALYEMGQTDKALENYDKAIEVDSTFSKAYATRGFVFGKMGQFDKAIADYDVAIALDPRDSQSYNNRGDIYEKMGQFDKAIADYNQVIALNPGESQSYNNRGVVLEKIGRVDKALEDYDRAIALNPSNADLYYNRGNAYDEMGQFDKAIADYDRAIALNPRDSQSYNNRGVVLEKIGRVDKALEDYDRAIALNPSNADADYNRRTALEKKRVFRSKGDRPEKPIEIQRRRESIGE